MRRIFRAYIQFGIAAVFLLSQMALAANDRALFHAVQADRATVFLLGSIHFADASFYPLRTEIERAFKNADQLVVEADILNMDQAQIQAFIIKNGMYQGQETLRDHISDETWKLLQAYISNSSMPIPEAMLLRQKPGMLAMTLSSLMLLQQGLSPDYGVDMHFLRQASQLGKPVLELEGVKQQIDMLLGLNMPELLLRQALDEVDDAAEMAASMTQAWKAGDTKLLHKLFIEDPIAENPDFEDLMEHLDFERNRQMVQKIDAYIERGGVYFVVVGAAHLLGEKGIPALLQKRGYTIKRL